MNRSMKQYLKGLFMTALLGVFSVVNGLPAYAAVGDTPIDNESGQQIITTSKNGVADMDARWTKDSICRVEFTTTGQTCFTGRGLVDYMIVDSTGVPASYLVLLDSGVSSGNPAATGTPAQIPKTANSNLTINSMASSTFLGAFPAFTISVASTTTGVIPPGQFVYSGIPFYNGLSLVNSDANIRAVVYYRQLKK